MECRERAAGKEVGKRIEEKAKDDALPAALSGDLEETGYISFGLATANM